jgi:glutaminyl-peptide cyclotransferase
MLLRHGPNVSLMASRRNTWLAIAAVLMFAGLALFLVSDHDDDVEAPPPSARGGFDADRAFADLRAQVELGPRPSGSEANEEQAQLLAERLIAAGAEGVEIQTPYRNVVGVIPGSEPGYVVVGAHHDTEDIPGLLGANDGASGVAVVLELARTLPNPLPGPSVALALFDAEEARGDRPFEVDGTRGSRQYVELAASGEQGTPPLGEIEAMVLFDMVGDCDLQIPRELNSDEGLYELFAEAAAGAPFQGETGPISDDHVPFLEAGIPAVDLIDFTYGPGGTPGAYWHTTEDTLDKVCPESLDAVGEAALEAIPAIGGR